jgi:hypothetical protein
MTFANVVEEPCHEVIIPKVEGSRSWRPEAGEGRSALLVLTPHTLVATHANANNGEQQKKDTTGTRQCLKKRNRLAKENEFTVSFLSVQIWRPRREFVTRLTKRLTSSYEDTAWWYRELLDQQ